MPLSLVTSWMATSAHAGTAEAIEPTKIITAIVEVRAFPMSFTMFLMSVLNRLRRQQIPGHRVARPEVPGCGPLDVGRRHVFDPVGPTFDVLDRRTCRQRRTIDVG